MNFTTEQKIAAIDRELKLRRFVYAARVASGKMTQAKADEEIGVMLAIKADYEKVAATDEPGLFGR